VKCEIFVSLLTIVKVWVRHIVERTCSWDIKYWGAIGEINREEFRTLTKDVMGSSYHVQTHGFTNRLNAFKSMTEFKTAKPENIKFKACVLGLIYALACEILY
jgi:hypothetical protein